MARFSKPPLASLGHCLVTASVKRRQSGCRVAMLISPEILQSLKGRRNLSMRKATSRYALMRVYRGFDGVQGKSCITMTVQSTGESLMSPANSRYGVQLSHGGNRRDIRQSDNCIVPEKPGNDGGGKAVA